MEIPQRPQLTACPEEPLIEGDVFGEKVTLSLKDAIKLKDWIATMRKCTAEHEVVLKGHLEKLENRLRALGAK